MSQVWIATDSLPSGEEADILAKMAADANAALAPSYLVAEADEPVVVEGPR